MGQKHQIQLFENKKVRSIWDEEQEKWYFAIVDVIEVLTDSANPQTYWRVLKNRLKKEGNGIRKAPLAVASRALK